MGFNCKEKKNEFLRAVDELQMAFAIAIVDREKPPRLTHIYDIIERWMPTRLLDKARSIDKDTAKRKIIAKMFENSVIGKAEDIRSFFGSKILT